jgi:ligand-binding SRPBCC domain-containing protein
MARIELETSIAAPARRCFDLSRDVDIHVASTAPSSERAVAGVTRGRMDLGDSVTWGARHFGIPWRMTSQIVAFERPRSFTDEMRRGPFARWHHVHVFDERNGATLMRDQVEYASPFGPLGAAVDALFLRRYMSELLRRRNLHIKSVAEAAATTGR